MNSSCRENHLECFMFYIMNLFLCVSLLLYPLFFFYFFLLVTQFKQRGMYQNGSVVHKLPNRSLLSTRFKTLEECVFCNCHNKLQEWYRDCFQPTNSVCWIFALVSAELRAVTGKKNLVCPMSWKSLRHNRHGHLRLFPVILRSGSVL